jgi:outer membrane lipoprotein
MVLVRAYGLLAFFIVIILPGCASSPEVIPESLEPQVDKNLTFKQLLESPDSYRGRVVVVGGEVLKAKRLQNRTQIEILQLPLDDAQEPMSNRAESQGRFLALQQEFVDPATLAEGTRVTIVREVHGAKTDRLDEMEYRYPTLTVKHLHVWPASAYESRRSGSWWGIFGGVGFGTGRSIGGVGIGTGF